VARLEQVRWLLTVVAVVAVGHVLVAGKSIILPLVGALFLWYLLSALVAQLARLPVRLPYWVRLAVAIAVVLGVLTLLSNIVAGSVREIADNLPGYQRGLAEVLVSLTRDLGVSEAALTEALVPQDLTGLLTRALTGVTSTAGQLGAVLLYTAFLLAEAHTFEPKVRALQLSPVREAALLSAANRIAGQIRYYVALKTLTSSLIGGLSFVVLQMFGVDFAPFWGVVTFVFNYVPYIGSFFAVMLPVLLSLLQFETFAPTLLLLGSLLSAQFMVGNIFEPRLMGHSLNLSPLVILLSLAAWGAIWGVPGMFFSVPLMVALMIVLSEFDTTKPVAVLLSERGSV
jgi:predicted PurR-regulated permease PerM